MIACQNGFPAISGTAGTNTFKSEWVAEFENVKIVYICYDSDEAGKEGALNTARYLKEKFPKTSIEEQRGSSRPDIVIEGIAIEVKGPTFESDLKTISDKCMRYRQSFSQGMIIVLFNVHVNQYHFNEWYNGMKNTFPDVKVIKK